MLKHVQRFFFHETILHASKQDWHLIQNPIEKFKTWHGQQKSSLDFETLRWTGFKWNPSNFQCFGGGLQKLYVRFIYQTSAGPVVPLGSSPDLNWNQQISTWKFTSWDYAEEINFSSSHLIWDKGPSRVISKTGRFLPVSIETSRSFHPKSNVK